MFDPISGFFGWKKWPYAMFIFQLRGYKTCARPPCKCVCLSLHPLGWVHSFWRFLGHQCTVAHQAWFSEKKLFFTDLGRNRLIFPAKSRVNQWYDWLNEQEIKLWPIFSVKRITVWREEKKTTHTSPKLYRIERIHDPTTWLILPCLTGKVR